MAWSIKSAAFLQAAIAIMVLLQPAASWELMGGLASATGMAKTATDDLTDANIDQYIKDHQVTAILFYAPWCFYSQQVMPAWDTAGQKLALHDPPIKLAKIDAHRYGSMGDKFGVVAYPTMKLFADGAVFEFDSRNGRGWQQIVNWVNQHTDRDHVLKKVEDIDHFLHDNDLNVVGLFPDGFNSSIFPKVARHYDEVVFAEAKGSEVANGVAEHLQRHAALRCETINVGASQQETIQVTLPRAGMHCSDVPRNPQRPEWTDRFATEVAGLTLTVKRTDAPGNGWMQLLAVKCCDDESTVDSKKFVKISVPSIVMFMPHDERFAVYDGAFDDLQALDRFVMGRRTPMLMRLNDEIAEKIMDSNPEKTPVLFLISPRDEPELEKLLTEAGRQLRGRVLICVSGVNAPIERRLAELAGVETDTGPVLTLIEVSPHVGPQHVARKYRLPTQGVSLDSIVTFVKDYENGKLRPWMKSEPEPSAEDQRLGGPVQVLVGTNFVSVSQDPEKDVLIDFYAPWCGHCRKLEPDYKELAKRLKHVKTLKIMKLDATRNEVEGMMLTGFPTIMLFKAGASPKQQVFYQGSRTVEDFTQFLHTHCTHKFDDRPPPEEVVKDPVETGLLDPSEEDL